ncbi:MAG: twin-arginine translocation signal domain-containing protein [Bacteroidales bacterium]|nr:twin-arginine translocation signal domain-containing protein [Bacteroidales bacterium]
MTSRRDFIRISAMGAGVLAAGAGITSTAPVSKLEEFIKEAVARGRKIHFLPPYRGENKMVLGSLLKENPCQMKTLASVDLIRAVVALRSIKEPWEIDEIEKAVEIAYEMHVTSMKMCKPGVVEQEIFGKEDALVPPFPGIIPDQRLQRAGCGAYAGGPGIGH